ncbi:endonuclease/exonuclease/phosphatase family protein, partial [Rivihabitans pingtungensis]|uniref:endonuclease/exonuclease/phosphatase family protein n=1 Tax=Rivihabitans pingtungensis TaxID=1054498 RepID=UPI0023F523EE
MQLATWNVNSLKVRLPQVLDWLAANPVDVLCLQELKQEDHAIVCIEDLQVRNMSKSSKGNAEQHGKQVRQKSGLNRAILDQGWGEFR